MNFNKLPNSRVVTDILLISVLIIKIPLSSYKIIPTAPTERIGHVLSGFNTSTASYTTCLIAFDLGRSSGSVWIAILILVDSKTTTQTDQYFHPQIWQVR